MWCTPPCCVWCTPVTCQLSAKSAKHSSNTVFLGIDFIRHAISVQMVEVFKPKLCAFLVHHTTRTHSASVWQLCCVTALHHLHTTYTRCRGQATSVALGFVGERRRYVVGGAAMAEPAGGGLVPVVWVYTAGVHQRGELVYTICRGSTPAGVHNPPAVKSTASRALQLLRTT